MNKYMKQRKYLIAKYNAMYTSKVGFEKQDCIYCGSDAQCTDHVPPLYHLENINVHEYKDNGGELVIYPACMECNALLGRSTATDFYERLDILSHKYQRKVDGMEAWTKHELNQMGRTLRNFIESHQSKIKLWIMKLEYIEDRKLQIELEDEN